MGKIVTLTTDLGWKDYYLGSIKGNLLSIDPTVNLVDISHNIKTYDILEAAFVLKNVYPNFPKGTIHLINVNSFQNRKPYFLVAKVDDQFFIGPDNGLFTLIFTEVPQSLYKVDVEIDSTFPLNTIIAKIVGHILLEKPLIEIGEPLRDIEQRIALQPVISKSQIRGTVIHIDNYENVIINITRALFERVQQGRNFSLYFKRFDPICEISRHYSDVSVGETLCLFNSAGYLEISINMGKAASMHSLNLDDTIQIDFEEEKVVPYKQTENTWV